MRPPRKAEQGQHGREQSRLDVNSPGLATKLALQDFVVNGFFSGIQIARTSRRQGDSGFFPGLEESKASHPEREKETDSPCPGGAGRDHPQSD
jgi:hypothetical protein